MESRFDMVRIYMPRLSLEETAREMGVRGPVRLKQPYLGFVDPLFTHISGMLVTMFANPEHAPALGRVDRFDQDERGCDGNQGGEIALRFLAA